MIIMRNKIWTVLRYVIIALVMCYGIYNIIYYARKLTDGYELAYAFGVAVYSLVEIISIICLILFIKKDIYRSRFTHNTFE